MLSLDELQRAARAVGDSFANHRVEKVIQPDAMRLVLVLYGHAGRQSSGSSHGESIGTDAADLESGGARAAKRCLVLSCHPELGRIGIAARPPRSPDQHPPFAQLARARLTGTRLRRVSTAAHDRLVRLVFVGRGRDDDPSAEEEQHELVLSLTGRRANLILLSGDQRVLAALRPLARTRPELTLGSAWSDPPIGAGVPQGGDRFASAVDGLELLRAIEEHYDEAQGEREGDDLARRLVTALRKERKHANKRLSRVEAELAEADQAGVLQRHGDLLKSALGRIKPGQREVIVDDWESGEPVAIPLDPAKTPKQNLDATFKRYQKLIRRLTKAGAQVDEARQRVEVLEALEREVEAADGPDALRALAERKEFAALLNRHAPPPPEVQRAAPRPKGPFAGLPSRLRPRRYLSSDGLEIWVGRSDEGNDHLSTRLARGKDLFFHVESSPGSHVVLRTEGRDDPPSESLLEAAELAVRFSKQKNAGRCDVHVVPIKNVKKPRGAKPGLVMVTGGRSLHLRRDEERLARVLAAQIPEDGAP